MSIVRPARATRRAEADAYWADEIHVRDGITFATITDDRLQHDAFGTSGCIRAWWPLPGLRDRQPPIARDRARVNIRSQITENTEKKGCCASFDPFLCVMIDGATRSIRGARRIGLLTCLLAQSELRLRNVRG